LRTDAVSTARPETSAGGVVYRLEDGAPLYLLIRDSYRNWGFPKGHIEPGEDPQAAAVREVVEETGLRQVEVEGRISTIDWHFRFRGQLIHKVCHFYLLRTDDRDTAPQEAEGITACRWATYDDASASISYANARGVLDQAHAKVAAAVRGMA
jgi:8-oxo-dGTP pyrophosphatase MutT (NUDIX family)